MLIVPVLPEGNETRYIYNSTGELITVTDAMGYDTKYEYDGNSRLVKTILANGAYSENAYDALGNLTEQTAYDGTKTGYKYDNCGRLLEKSVGGEKTTYSYDDKFRLTEVTNSGGTTQYSYDTYGRLVSKTDANKAKIGYTYDTAGRIQSVKTAYGTTKYEYDLLDRMTKVIDRNGNATVYEYDALGNRTAVRYPNGTVMSYTYDPCNRLKEEWLTDKEGNVLSGYVYTLDKEGKRTKIKETRPDGSKITISYEYDKLDRLTEETIKKGWDKIVNRYEYDAVSNRTKKKTSVSGDVEELADVSSGIASSVVEGTTEYTYNMLNQLVCESIGNGLREYTYDKNGNQIKVTSNIAGDKQAEYVYGKEGHLTVATQQVGNEVTITRYGYDYAGNRIWSQTNEQDKLYFVTDTTGLSMVLAETDAKGTEKAYYTIGQERISLSKTDEVWYYGYDGHGDTRILTDEKGAVTDTYSYDAWGNQLTKTGGTSNDYLYAGECFDANTGLYYLRARYMNPAVGLFISMDSYQGSIYEPVSLHKYLYANANPVRYTDPTGYFSFAETQIAQTIENCLREAYPTNFHKAMMMLNVASTCYSTTRKAVTSLLEGTKLQELAEEWLTGMVRGVALGIAMAFVCTAFKPLAVIISLLCTFMIVPQMIAGWENGDYDLAVADAMQLASSIGTLFMKCFTGDTLVATADGDKRIDQIVVGDYVWAEDTVTGEQVLKRVLKVYVKESDHLIHIGTSVGEDIL